MRLLSVLLAGALTSAVVGLTAVIGQSGVGSPYLVTWVGDADRADSDFLAVIDARQHSTTYGQIIDSIPVNARGTNPHHTEHFFTPGVPLFANGFGSGHTFRFDLTNPARPKLLGEVQTEGPLAFPHSFERLPNGNLLATMQAKNGRFQGPGGLAEFDNDGRLVRTSGAGAEGIQPNALRPYGLVVIPQADRVVSASERMALPPWDPDRNRERDPQEGYHVQLWRLSDLALLKTITLEAPSGTDANRGPVEPRVLEDGTVMVSTDRCGLYRIAGLEPVTFKGEFVYRHPGPGCWVPAVIGKYWLQSVQSLRRVVVLDLGNPSAPLEVSHVEFDSRQAPHWLSVDPLSRRVVMTNSPGAPDHRIWMLNFDPLNGRVSIDERFRDAGSQTPGISFDRPNWPHGPTGDSIPHGTIFVR
jgi:hypothetical protein